jgi:hypothetical protein
MIRPVSLDPGGLGVQMTGVTNIYEHKVYTLTIHHFKKPEVHKYRKFSKMYFQYLI